MRLESFRIRNCFGFVDSDEIDFGQPNNLVYFLGRNSSGKTSVLRAISHFEYTKTPEEHPRFQNYERSGGTPLLQAKFSLDADEDGRVLSARHIVDSVIQRFANTPLSIEEGEDGYKVTPENAPISRRIAALLDYVHKVYSELIDRILAAGEVWIVKLSSGSYRFLTTEGNHSEYTERKEAVESLISNELQSGNSTFQVQNRNYNVAIVFEHIEQQLFKQFPEIFLFTERFSLDEDLPRSIRNEHLNQRQNDLTEAFMDLLDRKTLGSYLHASERRRIAVLEQELQERLDKLCEKINEDALSGGADELVKIYVDRSDDIRVLLEVGGQQESHYEHVSDNTKFLVAYHIFQEDRERKNALPSILLFDEPNKGFHPSAEGKMLRFLEYLTETNNQVFLTTHSQHMIDLDRLSAIRIMGRSEDRTLQVSNRIYRPASPGGDILALQPITEAMGLHYAGQMVVKDKVIVTEGYTDMLYLRVFNRLLSYEAELNIAPLRGDSQISQFVPFLISQGIAFKIVLDSSSVKRDVQRGFPAMEDAHFFVVPVSSGISPKHSVGIEDMATKNDFESLLKRYGYAVNTKKLANVSNSNYVKQEKIKSDLATRIHEDNKLSPSFFEQDTIQSFEQALNFCASDVWFSM